MSAQSLAWLACFAAAASAALALPTAARPLARTEPDVAALAPVRGGARRGPWALSALAGLGAAAFVGGTAAWVIGPAAAGAALVVLRRAEDPAERRARQAAAAELPHVVLLLAAALRGGAAAGAALAIACDALPGAATARVEGVRARLELGVDPLEAWAALSGDVVLAPLGRTLVRAARSGAPVADAVERLSIELARQARASREDHARTVGVRAALPLGLCLLPAFLLLGIVPLVAGLFAHLVG